MPAHEVSNVLGAWGRATHLPITSHTQTKHPLTPPLFFPPLLQATHTFFFVNLIYSTAEKGLSVAESFTSFVSSPPLWARQYNARLSCSRPGFNPRLGQVSWVRFFWGFFSPVRQMLGNFRPPRSTNSSSIIIHYGCQ